MIEMRDRIEEIELVSAGRYEPICRPYILHIRERFNEDGTVTTIHRKRVYDGEIFVVDEKI